MRTEIIAQAYFSDDNIDIVIPDPNWEQVENVIKNTLDLSTKIRTFIELTFKVYSKEGTIESTKSYYAFDGMWYAEMTNQYIRHEFRLFYEDVHS